MSRSIHITRKNFKGLSKKAIDEQANDPHSELSQWATKLGVKKSVKKARKKK
jgi:hypothetical protein